MSDENEPVVGEPPAPEPQVPRPPEVPPVSGVPTAPQMPTAVPYAPVEAPKVPRERRGGAWFGFVLIIVGLALLANRFIPGFDVWRYWPVAVILLGVSMVLKGLRR